MIDANKLKHIGAIVCVGSSAALFLTADIHPAHAPFGSLGGPRPVAITGIAGWIVAELRLCRPARSCCRVCSRRHGVEFWRPIADWLHGERTHGLFLVSGEAADLGAHHLDAAV